MQGRRQHLLGGCPSLLTWRRTAGEEARRARLRAPRCFAQGGKSSAGRSRATVLIQEPVIMRYHGGARRWTGGRMRRATERTPWKACQGDASQLRTYSSTACRYTIYTVVCFVRMIAHTISLLHRVSHSSPVSEMSLLITSG